MGRRRRVGSAAALIAVVLLVVGEAWIPFGSERVRVERESPIVAGGDLNFQGESVLIGERGPEWLSRSVETGRFELRLQFMTYWPDQSDAQIFAISNTVEDANLAIAQDDMDLVISVRRAGATAAGLPAFRLEKVLDDRPQQLGLTIDGAWMDVAIDAQVVRRVRLSGGSPVTTWDAAQRVVIGDEELGGRGWVGGVFAASVVGGAVPVDLLSAGVLHPGTGTFTVVRPRTFDRPSDTALVPVLLRLALFAPLGFATAWLMRRPWLALGICCGVVLVLAAGKSVVPSRHPSVAEVVLGAAGSGVGVALAVVRRQRTTLNADRRLNHAPAGQP